MADIKDRSIDQASRYFKKKGWNQAPDFKEKKYEEAYEKLFPSKIGGKNVDRKGVRRKNRKV